MRRLLELISASSALLGAAASGTASGAGSATSSSASSAASLLPWGDCAFEGSALAKPRNFDCLTLQVPLCYSGAAAAPCASSATHALRMMRRQTDKNATDAPTVWIAAETSATGKTADLMERLSQQQGGVAINVYAMETRHANPPVSVDCGALAVKFGAHKTIDGDVLDAVARCSKWITTTLGENGISVFSLDSAARDLATGLDRVRETELKANPNVYVLATGTASRVVQRFMATTNATFAGFVFDTPHTMKMPPNQDEIVGTSMARFLDGCESDGQCRDHYAKLSMSMRDALKKLEDVVDQPTDAAEVSQCIRLLKNASYVEARDLQPSHGLRRYIVEMRQRTSAYQVTSPLLYRAHLCEDTDIFKRLLKSINLLNDGLPLVPQTVSSMVEFVDRVVAYSEFWPTPMPSRDQLAKLVDASLLTGGSLLLQQPSYCLYHASNSSTCAGFYKRAEASNASRALVYAPPARPDSGVNSTTGLMGSTTADALILTSRISTVASSQVSEQLYEAFAGGKSGRTVVMIQSDNAAATELEGPDAELLLRVVGEFVARQAAPLSGKWYIRDLSASNTLVSAAAVSTLETAPLNVNFTLTSWQMGFLASAISKDAYEQRKDSASTDCAECEAKEEAKLRMFLIFVGVAVGLFFAWMIWFSYFRQPKAKTAQPERAAAPRVVVTHSNYDYQTHYYSAAPEPLQPQPWPSAPYQNEYHVSNRDMP